MRTYARLWVPCEFEKQNKTKQNENWQFHSYSSLGRPGQLGEVCGGDFLRCPGGERAWKRFLSRATPVEGYVLPDSVWPQRKRARAYRTFRPAKPVVSASSQPPSQPVTHPKPQPRRSPRQRGLPVGLEKKKQASLELSEDEIPSVLPDNESPSRPASPYFNPSFSSPPNPVENSLPSRSSSSSSPPPANPDSVVAPANPSNSSWKFPFSSALSSLFSIPYPLFSIFFFLFYISSLIFYFN